ncbi:hypothetical protein AB0F17_28550 [Nonomuraea sp. NPDC026600]|uniref:hypothetical protein n=1 Tax=Nonomuraea sp. NPDC026600 TaxID=3155363 RepID=UPI0033F607A1
MTLAFLATSRTGSNPRLHELYEIALIEHGGGQPDRRSIWRLRPQRLPDADPAELARSGYHQRKHYGHDVVYIDADLQTATPVDPYGLAAELSARLFEIPLMTLDLREVSFLGRFLEAHRALPAWSRTVDVTAGAAFYMQGLRAGWLAAARHADRMLPEPELDFAAAYDPRPDPYRIARALHVTGEDIGDDSDALTRATLAMHLWTSANAAPMMPPPAHEQGDRLVAPTPAAGDTAVLNLAELADLTS